jgi:hypothetical protein
MGYNPHEHVCELFDFECMCKNDRNVYCEKILTTSNPLKGMFVLISSLKVSTVP